MSLGILWSGGDVDGVVASWNVYAVLDLLRGSEVNAIYRDNLEGLHRDLLIGLFEHKLQELKASAYALKASFFHLRTCRMAYELLAFYVKAIEASLAAPA
ncbi:Uncharacterized protein FKW44_009660 [Caligus rogercresseyi]|uniref:Uncharacterized protein n=1 Tax=Caligus rogercresseyi TaxID=217165 RepID=A0A7T8HGL1_CALRO|nr:Uncharacterized protein FKW44_009660 [Caligus rogercresseyi]